MSQAGGYLRVMSILGHELRTPLTVIRGAATLVLQAHEQLPTDRMLEMLQLIDDNSETMAERIEDMLSLSHLDAGDLRLNLEAVAVSELLQPAVASAERLGLARVEAEGVVDAVAVEADRERAVQALRSLLANSVRRAGRGGVVRVEVVADPTFVRFDVSDQGAASQSPLPTDQPALRSRELTSAADLNLYLASGLANAMGGEVQPAQGGSNGEKLWFTLKRHV